MKIAIGADHRGAKQKELIKEHITHVAEKVIQWFDVGCFIDQKRCEYPIYAQLVAQLVQTGNADRGVLLCGSGVGMAIAANRFKYIYAALVWNETIARLSREHDKSNVLVFGSDFVADSQVLSIIHTWLSAQFLGGNHEERIAIIDEWGGLSLD